MNTSQELVPALCSSELVRSEPTRLLNQLLHRRILAFQDDLGIELPFTDVSFKLLLLELFEWQDVAGFRHGATSLGKRSANLTAKSKSQKACDLVSDFKRCFGFRPLFVAGGAQFFFGTETSLDI